MLSKIVRKTSLVSVRNYRPGALMSMSDARIKVTRTRADTIIATVDNASGISQMGVYFRAGARYNTVPGASMGLQFLASAGKSTPNHSGLHMTRVREQEGITLDINADRDLMSYFSVFPEHSVETALDVLSSLTSNSSYFEHEHQEYDEIRMNAALTMSPVEKVKDMIFQAAFRSNPLGNSVFVPDHFVKTMKVHHLNDFMQKTHGQSGMVVVASGVDHLTVVDAASSLGVVGGVTPCVTAQSPYLGGDSRLEMGGDLSTVIVAGEGAAFGSVEEAATLVAASLMVSPPSVKYCKSLCAAVVGAADIPYISLTPFCQRLEETGLLGFQLVASAEDTPMLVRNVTAAIKRLNPSESGVAMAKNKAKAALLHDHCESNVVSILGRSLLFKGESYEIEDLVKAIDAVSVADVKTALKKSFEGKLSVAAIGAIHQIPYSDTL